MKRTSLSLLLTSGYLLADSSVALAPTMMVLLPNKYLVSAEYLTKENPSLHYSGSIKAGSTTYNNISTDSTKHTQNFVGVYAVSPWVDGYRFAIMLHPNIADSVHNSWSNTLAMASAKEYNLSYNSIIASVCKSVSKEVFVGASLNTVLLDAKQEVSLLPSLYADLKGDGSGNSLTISAMYVPSANFAILASQTTKTNIALNGEVYGQVGSYTARANSSLDTLLPSETTIAAMYKASKSTSVQAVVKRRWWSEYETQDIQIQNPTLEATFGRATTKQWLNVDSALVSVGFNEAAYLLQVGSIVYTASNNEKSAALTRASFGGKALFGSASYKLSDNMTIGAKLTRVWQNGGNIDNETFRGNIDSAQKNVVVVFSKWQW